MKIKCLLSLPLTLLFCFTILSCDSSEKIAKGNEYVAQIESFRKERGRLPSSLTEIEIAETESGPIYYEKKNESKYILWFGKELGESVVYDSDTKQWK